MSNIEFYWSVTKLEVIPKFEKMNNVLKRVSFQVTAKDKESAEISALAGETILVNPKKETFIPYSDLTEELVLKMVKRSIGERAVFDYEEELRNNLKTIVEPEFIEKTPPWSEQDEVEKVVLFKAKKQ